MLLILTEQCLLVKMPQSSLQIKKTISNFNIIHGALKSSLPVFKEIIHTIRSSKKSQLFLPSLPALGKHILQGKQLLTTPLPPVFIQPFKNQCLPRSLTRTRLYTSSDKQPAVIKI